MFWMLTRWTDPFLVGYNTSTSSTITVPSGVQTGDMIVLFDNSTALSTPALVTPSGYTNIVNDTATSGFNMRQSACYKVSDGTDSGATLTGMGDTTRKTVLVFRCTGRLNPTIQDVTSQATGGTAITNQTVNASAAALTTVVVNFASALAETKGFTPTQNGTTRVSTTENYVYYRFSSGATSDDVTCSTTDNGSLVAMSSFYIQWT